MFAVRGKRVEIMKNRKRNKPLKKSKVAQPIVTAKKNVIDWEYIKNGLKFTLFLPFLFPVFNFTLSHNGVFIPLWLMVLGTGIIICIILIYLFLLSEMYKMKITNKAIIIFLTLALLFFSRMATQLNNALTNNINIERISPTLYLTNDYNHPVRLNPYGRTGDIVGHLEYQAEMIIVGRAINSFGNMWYLRNDGGWIYSGNVDRVGLTACVFHLWNENGFCVYCDAEYELVITPIDFRLSRVTASNAPIRNRPYGASDVVSRKEHGEYIHIVGVTTNFRGNRWYLISSNYDEWIYSGNIE